MNEKEMAEKDLEDAIQGLRWRSDKRDAFERLFTALSWYCDSVLENHSASLTVSAVGVEFRFNSDAKERMDWALQAADCTTAQEMVDELLDLRSEDAERRMAILRVMEDESIMKALHTVLHLQALDTIDGRSGTLEEMIEDLERKANDV